MTEAWPWRFKWPFVAKDRFQWPSSKNKSLMPFSPQSDLGSKGGHSKPTVLGQLSRDVSWHRCFGGRLIFENILISVLELIWGT